MNAGEAAFFEACVLALYSAERQDVVSSLDRLQVARDQAERLIAVFKRRGEMFSAQSIADHLGRTFEECKIALSRGDRPVLGKTKVDGRARGLLATDCGHNLWQAKVPRTRKGRVELGAFATVVSCAKMPSTAGPHLCVPLPVTGQPLTKEDRANIRKAVDVVYKSVARGKRTIVLCADGKVASGLIVALVLRKLAKQPWMSVLRKMQQLREGAVGNLYFVQVLVEEEGK